MLLRDIPAIVKEGTEMFQSYVGERDEDVYEMKLIRQMEAAVEALRSDEITLHRIAGTLQNIIDNVEGIMLTTTRPDHETQAEFYLRNTMINVKIALKSLNSIVPPPERV